MMNWWKESVSSLWSDVLELEGCLGLMQSVSFCDDENIGSAGIGNCFGSVVIVHERTIGRFCSW